MSKREFEFLKSAYRKFMKVSTTELEEVYKKPSSNKKLGLNVVFRIRKSMMVIEVELLNIIQIYLLMDIFMMINLTINILYT